MNNWQIEFYAKSNGDKPAEEFILNLDPKMQAKAILELELLEKKGNTLREPYSKRIENGLFELRIKHLSNISRIFYFFFVGRKIVMTNGFIKKTQKTPRGEIQKALNYKNDYLERHK
jgi:phage-related protein